MTTAKIFPNSRLNVDLPLPPLVATDANHRISN